MNKLFKLKEWLTIADTAKHLSIAFSEEVTEADVLRLGLEKKLTLSVNFINQTYVCEGTTVSLDETRWSFQWNSSCIESHELDSPRILSKHELNEALSFFSQDDPSYPLTKMISTKLNDESYVNFNENLKGITGIWNLTMIGTEVIDIEHKYQLLTNGAEVTSNNFDGIIVERDGVICKLMDVNNPANEFPADSILVVRTSAISILLDSLCETPDKAEKPFKTKERNSMLTLIAALCGEAKIDINQRGVAVSLAKSTEILGCPLCEDTILKFLKEARDRGL